MLSGAKHLWSAFCSGNAHSQKLDLRLLRALLRMTLCTRPDILFIMTDQQRFDTIAALGNSHIYTPNMDRLVRRGISFSNAYATCPVCVAARYTIRTGCEPATTRVFS